MTVTTAFKTIAAGCLLAAVVFTGAAQAQTPFYQADPAEIAGAPGTLIRMEAMAFGPVTASSYRVLYRSRGMRNEPIAVSGVIIVPNAPTRAPRPVVAWAHPTSGVVPHCAPSLATFFYQQVQGLAEMVARGYVVTATDYPGLGTPGPHPYLVGTSEGRAVIDSVRAAAQLPGVGTVRDFIVWGHSQGGQAALFTGLMAKSYAPELRLRGVAAAAPATDLATLMTDDFNTAGGKNLTAMTLWSWSQVYGAPIRKLIRPEAMPTVAQLSNTCIESIFDILARGRIEKPLETGFLTVDNLASLEPWRTLLARNTPAPLPRSIPVLLAQGTTDNVVPPRVTESYMRRLCAGGSAVRLVLLPGVGHGFVARDSAAAAVGWMADRFAGLAAPDDCNAVRTAGR